MSFAAIEGHDRPITILKRALVNKTVAHAYLFSGETGIGKKMAALALAAAVNCGNAGPDGGCGECPSCRKVASGGHPDVRIVASDGDDIKIDQVRELQAALSLKPFEGVKKVLIIDGAERMNAASANAFLKTLEEPPGDALVILVTPLPQSLLPTIRSRCQELRFSPLPRKTLAGALARLRGFGEEDARFLAALAKGSMGRALEMDLEREREDRGELLALWTGLPRMSSGEVLVRADALSKDRDRLERLLDMGVAWLRDAMVLRETGDEALLVDGQAAEFFRQWGERVSLQRMLADMELLVASRGLLERRVSAQLVTENLLLKLGEG